MAWTKLAKWHPSGSARAAPDKSKIIARATPGPSNTRPEPKRHLHGVAPVLERRRRSTPTARYVACCWSLMAWTPKTRRFECDFVGEPIWGTPRRSGRTRRGPRPRPDPARLHSGNLSGLRIGCLWSMKPPPLATSKRGPQVERAAALRASLHSAQLHDLACVLGARSIHKPKKRVNSGGPTQSTTKDPCTPTWRSRVVLQYLRVCCNARVACATVCNTVV